MFDQAVLDDFNRASENPLSKGGVWKHTNSRSARTVSNVWVAAQAATTLFHEPRYEGAGPFTDSEAYVTLQSIDEWNLIACRLQSVTSPTGTVSGYMSQWAPGSFYLVKRVADAQTILGGPWTVTLSAGDKIGVRAIGTAIQGWYYKAGAWTMAGSATDAVYASGYLGLGINKAGLLDNFGGGAPVTAPTFVPQIIIS